MNLDNVNVTSQKNEHPLTFQAGQFTSEFNLSKVLGQIAGAVATALITRWVVSKYDEWKRYSK